jgi:hypothetical protein
VAQGEVDKTWSRKVAVLAVDALLDAKIVTKSDFERAVDIVAEEIFVRLGMGDRPFLQNYN